MEYRQFLSAVIDAGLEAVHQDYHQPTQDDKRDGSVAGFNACRDKDPEELADLLTRAHSETSRAQIENRDNYWWYRCYELEVGWVCNVVSALLVATDKPIIIPPTLRGTLQASKILCQIK
jgi:hypothetical protein